MVNAQEVSRLTDELQRLRGAVVRDPQAMSEQLRRVRRDCDRLQREAVGSPFEPALTSVQSLLQCVERGLASQQELNTRFRKAG
jgi:hypothetical protein